MERLRQLPFDDRARASREMGELSRWLPPATLNRFDLLLSASAAPEQGLRYFARLHEQQPSWFQKLTRSTTGLRYLIAVFTNSHFLAEEVLRHPEWADHLLESGSLHGVIPPEQMREMLESALPAGLPAPLDLAKFRRRQMLRILIRDVLGLGPLPEITGELTSLADTIVETAYARIKQHAVSEFGTPRDEAGNEAHFAVIALGKMGGNELNYSSDIDLMFLYSANGETAGGPRSISNREFFARAANQLTSLLSTYTSEGMCYRLDLRLRPDGSHGEVCISLEAARQYYDHRARDWELQMMIKSRVAAGDKATGRALLDYVEPLTYATTLDFSAIEQMSATRERLTEKLSARNRSRHKLLDPDVIDVKLARGGIRDIEFLVQCLQRLYGGSEPWVRHGGTMLALARLQDKGFLSGTEYGRLASAYQFLRQLEHRLQFADDRQTHTLPVDAEALELLGRRMPSGGGTAAWLLMQTNLHLEQVREIYDRVVHARASADSTPSGNLHPASNIVRALEQRAPHLAAALSRPDVRRGFRAFEHLLERISNDPVKRLERLDADPQFAAHVLDLFEHSPYFAEELIRTPELLDEVERAGAAHDLSAPPSTAPSGAADLRRWYRREMVRIQTASICLSEPIFDTLVRTSDLADEVIARAYEIAVAEVRGTRPPSESGYEPAHQMWVVALGRLGMREFDLASDADLVFVLADADAKELEFWTRAAERLVDLITAYTGEGVLFAVDTRLRPNGSSGPLVVTEGSFKDYFARTAEAWEGITYMKSRVVAGDAGRGERFLHELQDLDWQRYGQSGRSRTDLRQMRMRLEKETGAAHPLKAGRGGFYDIDFMLMYLRLKNAGVYYKVLNTPERIEVLESMGHLDKQGAKFLKEAATFYRALDHGIRVLTGHAEAKLPTAETQVEALAALLRRWSPIPLSALDDIRSRTRMAFEKLFG
jgi:glutamate-ammonia-ligase adenylyltransferase